MVYPVLDCEEGRLQYSSVIVRYLANGSALDGASNIEKATVRNWCDFVTYDLDPVLLALVAPVFGQLPYDSKKHDLALRDLRALFQVLNDQLKKSAFLVGGKVTLADVSVACSLINCYKFVLDADFRKSFLSVFTWFEKLLLLKEFKAVWGHVHACQKPFVGQTST